MFERILECIYESCLRVLTTRERLAQFILLNARSVKLLIVKTQQVAKRIFPELTNYTLICRFFSSTDWLNIKATAVIRMPVSVSHIRNTLLNHTIGFQQLKAPLRTGEQLILKCVRLLILILHLLVLNQWFFCETSTRVALYQSSDHKHMEKPASGTFAFSDCFLRSFLNIHFLALKNLHVFSNVCDTGKKSILFLSMPPSFICCSYFLVNPPKLLV